MLWVFRAARTESVSQYQAGSGFIMPGRKRTKFLFHSWQVPKIHLRNPSNDSGFKENIDINIDIFQTLCEAATPVWSRPEQRIVASDTRTYVFEDFFPRKVSLFDTFSDSTAFGFFFLSPTWPRFSCQTRVTMLSRRSDNQMRMKTKRIDHVEIVWLHLRQILSTTSFKWQAALTTRGYQLPLVCTHVFDIGGTAVQLLSALSGPTVTHKEEKEQEEGPCPFLFLLFLRKTAKENGFQKLLISILSC